ncbi:MAG: hypothetical protein IJW31_09865 [Lentisphaeria bacterium]|nr:hypothetical protein [Lentisphaeria bacterium]
MSEEQAPVNNNQQPQPQPQPQYQQPTPQFQIQNVGTGLAVTSLIFGILFTLIRISLTFSKTPYFANAKVAMAYWLGINIASLILVILAVVPGVIALSCGKGKEMAVTGILLASILPWLESIIRCIIGIL